MSYLITAAINDSNDFEAARLILIRTGRATLSNAAFETWRRGPIEGQAIIQEWLDQHPEALEDQEARATPPDRAGAERMTYAIAKHFRGELIAYMVRDQGNEELTFTSRDLADAFTMDDRDEAEQLAHDWQAYWQSKGLTATNATVVEVSA